MPLAQPPRNQNGEVEPHDHIGILDNHGVIRRISPHHFVDDEKAGGKRLSTMAFTLSTTGNRGMSVDIEKSIVEAGLDARTYVVTPPFIGAVRFTAGSLRQQAFSVGYDPLTYNPHHGEVWGTLSKSKQKWLCANAEMYVEPKG